MIKEDRVAQNFGRDKRRIEEMKRKRREAKQSKRLSKRTEGAAPAEELPGGAIPPGLTDPLPGIDGPQ